jgi:general stress protein 26
MSDLASDPHVNVAFMDAEGEWASLSGMVEMLGRDAVKKLYTPELRAWMGDLGDGECDGGPDDPRLGVIKVKVLTATYSILRADNTRQVEGGLKTGETPRVVRLREIGNKEVEWWRRG